MKKILFSLVAVLTSATMMAANNAAFCVTNKVQSSTQEDIELPDPIEIAREEFTKLVYNMIRLTAALYEYKAYTAAEKLGDAIEAAKAVLYNEL